MRVTATLASLLGLPSPWSVGFLACILVAFFLGYEVRRLREERRHQRWRKALWRGERVR